MKRYDRQVIVEGKDLKNPPATARGCTHGRYFLLRGRARENEEGRLINPLG
jgi:hypothetical protein